MKISYSSAKRWLLAVAISSLSGCRSKNPAFYLQSGETVAVGDASSTSSGADRPSGDDTKTRNGEPGPGTQTSPESGAKPDPTLDPKPDTKMDSTLPGTSSQNSLQPSIDSTPDSDSSHSLDQSSELTASNTTTSSTASTTSRPSDSTSSTASAESSSSAPLPPVCQSGPEYCHDMQYTAANIDGYPDTLGGTSVLKLVFPQNTAVAENSSPAPIFSKIVNVNGGGLLRSGRVELGNNGFYGFDVSIKAVGCRDNANKCRFAAAGFLALVIDAAGSSLSCVGYEGNTEKATATISASLAQANNVGCYVAQDKVFIRLNGQAPQTSPDGENYSLPNSTHVTYEVGASPAQNMPGVAFGEVGRIRYWTELGKMVQTLEKNE